MIINKTISRKLQNINDINIVCDGNSLTAGQGSTTGFDYPSQLENEYYLNIFNKTTINKGVGGQTTLDMIADAPTDIDILIDSDKENVLLAWEIRNHLVIDAPTNELAYDKFVEYCNDRRNAGWKVIIGTILPSWAASYRGDNTVIGYNLLDSDRLEINDLLRDSWRGFSDGLADLGDIDGLSNLGDNEESGYVFNSTTRPTISANGLFSDGTHLTDNGYELIAKEFYYAIWKML